MRTKSRSIGSSIAWSGKIKDRMRRKIICRKYEFLMLAISCIAGCPAVATLTVYLKKNRVLGIGTDEEKRRPIRRF